MTKDIVEAVREQAKEQGRQEERAAIVAWLRNGPQFINWYWIADALEAGEHLK